MNTTNNKDGKSIDTIKPRKKKDNLTAEEIKFSRLIAKGYTLTKAYKEAFPAKRDLAPITIRQYAAGLYAKSNIQQEVETAKETNAYLTRLAEERLQDALENGRDGLATNQVAMFMYDHANGKATQRVEGQLNVVTLSVDLRGINSGDKPVIDL